MEELPRFDGLAHQVVRHAKEAFTGEPDVDLKRESISGLTDPPWWKLKTGRWRGAVYVDEVSGQAWVCAAGLRREGEGSDFYKAFMRQVEASGAAQFLPTDEDMARLSHERAAEAITIWEQELDRVARACLLGAETAGESTVLIPDPSAGEPLAKLTVAFTSIDEDEQQLLEVLVTIEPADWNRPQLVQYAEIVVLAGICPDEQVWVPGHGSAASMFSLVMTADEFSAACAKHRQPGQTFPGDEAHYAHRARLTESVIEGSAVRAMCGVWFVPRQDHETLDGCVKCKTLIAQLPA